MSSVETRVDDGQRQQTAKRKNFRRQYSLRRFFVLVLLLGVAVPSGLHYLARLQQKRDLLQWQKFAFSSVSSDERERISRALDPPSLWGTIWYRLGREVLPTQKVNLVRPQRGTQQYQVIDIDTRPFNDDEFLIVRIALGGGCGASLDLFHESVDLSGSPAEQERARSGTLARFYNVDSHETGVMVFKPQPGKQYQLGISGSWNSTQGNDNTAMVSIHAASFPGD